MIDTKGNKDVFDRIAGCYIREDSHWGSDLDLIKTSLDKLIEKQSNPHWLDIGCGPAFHLTSIAEFYPEVKATGIDYSPTMLEEAKKRIKKVGIKNIDFKELDITRNSIPHGSGLITFLNNGFGNVCRNGTNPSEIRGRIINNIITSLSEGGHFILSVYNIEQINKLYGGNLEVLENLSDIRRGDLFVEYSPRNNGKIIYYSHWFSEKELHDIALEHSLAIDFLERRMSRFLARYKK